MVGFLKQGKPTEAENFCAGWILGVKTPFYDAALERDNSGLSKDAFALEHFAAKIYAISIVGQGQVHVTLSVFEGYINIEVVERGVPAMTTEGVHAQKERPKLRTLGECAKELLVDIPKDKEPKRVTGKDMDFGGIVGTRSPL